MHPVRRNVMNPNTFREAHAMSRTVSALLLPILLALSASTARAHKDPADCSANSVVSVSLFAQRDADGDGVPETQIIGSPVPPLEPETAYYVPSAAKLTRTNF